MLDGTDPWVKEIAKITRVIGPLLSFARRSEVKKAMTDYAINAVLAVKQAQPSLNGMSIPTNWFRLQPHVSDSALSETLNRQGQAIYAWGTGSPMFMGANISFAHCVMPMVC